MFISADKVKRNIATKPAVLDVILKQLLMTCGRTVLVLDSNLAIDIAIHRQVESLKALSVVVGKTR